MKKYLIKYDDSFGIDFYSIILTADESTFTSFPAVIGNPNYDKFLVDAELTDKKVKELTTDKWYDFPKSEEASAPKKATKKS
jgi:hypothetical protein